jgi:hypothetical protein
MRLSSDKSSPHYRDDFMFWYVAVDGVKLNGCVVEADSDEGWADVLQTTDHGRLVRDPEGNDWLAPPMRLHGKVEFTFNSEEQHERSQRAIRRGAAQYE